MAHGTAIIEALTADGWSVDEEAYEALDGDVALSSPEALKALISPVRLQLIGHLARQPASVKELAEVFDVPTTRLYHHLSVLEEHAVIAVVGTRRSGARTERCYAGRRGGVTIGEELMSGHADEVANAVTKIVSLAGESAAAAIRAERLTLDNATEAGLLSWTAPRLTPEQRAGFIAELTDLVGRVSATSEANANGDVDDAESTLMLFLATPDVTFWPST